MGVVQYNPYGSLETIGPDQNRVMNKSNGSLIAVRRVGLLLWLPLQKAQLLAWLGFNSIGHSPAIRPIDQPARALSPPLRSCAARSYEARAAGVKRNMRGDEARRACPDIQLVQVPTAHGKADLTLYRGEGERPTDSRAAQRPCACRAEALGRRLCHWQATG